MLFGLLLQPKVELEGLAKGIELVEHTEAKQVGPGSARTSALGPPPHALNRPDVHPPNEEVVPMREYP